LVKRPLIWILTAYLCGMYLAWRYISAYIVVLLILVLFICSYLIFHKVKLTLIGSGDKFIWSLPFILLLGFLVMGEQLKRPALYQAFDQKIFCEVTGKINMIVKKPSGQAIYLKNNIVTLPEENSYKCEAIIVFCDETTGSDNNSLGSSKLAGYQVGNEITVQGTLQKFSKATNPGQFNEQLYYDIENIDFKLRGKSFMISDFSYSHFHSTLNQIKEKLIEVYSTILSEKESGALIAMLLGEKYLLGDEIKTLYQQNGISHVLAISGLHISLIGMFVFSLLKRLRIPIYISTFITIFILYSYGVLTNFSVSTNRAVVMMVVLLMASLIGKTYDLLSAMSLSAFIILLQNPLQIFSAGFLLSFGAILGIAMIHPCFRQLFPGKNIILDSIYISTSAQLATAPIIAFFYFQLPLYGILVNLIILPFVTVLTLTSILAGMIGVINLPLGIFFVGGANYILQFYEWICRLGSELPLNLITVGKPNSLKLVLYAIIMGFFLWTTKHYNKKICCLLPLIASVLLLIPDSQAGLRVVFLDVGQGDSIYLEHEDNTTFLIDGGSSDISKVGKYRLKPFLLSQGKDELTYVIMTHADEDHINGLKELMEEEEIKIKTLILPKIIDKDKGYLEIEALAREKGIRIWYCKAGDMIKDGNLELFCLHPAEGMTGADTNSYSAVFSVKYKAFDLLLTGDMGQEQEASVLQDIIDWRNTENNHSRPSLQYDILKVAHHGSRNSTSKEFIELIKPEYAIISCGMNNRYGHPHEELLERLDEMRSEMVITNKSGAITVKTDGKRMVVEEYLE
jgi:competence protein ComEC